MKIVKILKMVKMVWTCGLGVGCGPNIVKFAKIVKMVKMVCAFGSGVWAVYPSENCKNGLGLLLGCRLGSLT